MRKGRHYAISPKCHVRSQRYTEVERRLLEGVAGGPDSVSAFIHDAAVDRAQQFADHGAHYDAVRDHIEDDEGAQA